MGFKEGMNCCLFCLFVIQQCPVNVKEDHDACYQWVWRGSLVFVMAHSQLRS
jgi:hypothetical protein